MTAGTLARRESLTGHRRTTGCVIVNADDWGRDRGTTDRTFDCIHIASVSSVSAMVFMADSERAANLAKEAAIDVGLHVNLTTPFTSPKCPTRLAEHQTRVSRYLRSSRFAQVLFHPGLMGSFSYAVAAQLEEFTGLYGTAPDRVDGHHHMHL
ncbi:MAG: ChbG/HpnK family deacetylase, partial [Bryobacteraceae bacterium]